MTDQKDTVKMPIDVLLQSNRHHASMHPRSIDELAFVSDELLSRGCFICLVLPSHSLLDDHVAGSTQPPPLLKLELAAPLLQRQSRPRSTYCAPALR